MYSERTDAVDLIALHTLVKEPFPFSHNFLLTRTRTQWNPNLSTWHFWPWYKGLQHPPKYLMTAGILQCSTAVGTAEAANMHSCFCLPTLLRRLAGGGCGNGGTVLCDEMSSTPQGPHSRARLSEFWMAECCSPQTTHLYLPPPGPPLPFLTMLRARMSYTTQAAANATNLLGKGKWWLVWGPVPKGDRTGW